MNVGVEPIAAEDERTAQLRGPLACVDLETTGGAAAQDRVIEIGVVLLDDGAVVEEWSSLVNPGCNVPRGVTALTGIDSDMLADAPRFDELSAALRGRLDGRLFVAHNAGFDYGFVRSEFRRCGVRFSAPALCTVRLSRALFPDECAHNLDALLERHGLACDARHRALGDARVLPALLAAFESQVGRARLASAVAAQLRVQRLPPGLAADLAEALPEAPGVYVFRGERGAALFVGMGRNLRSRVLAHFSCNHAARDEFLVSDVRDVEWFETGGELGALLLESRLIGQLAPRARRRRRAEVAAWVIRLVAAGQGTQVRLAPLDAAAHEETDEAYGPFGSEQAARRALEGLGREAALCPKLLGLESGEGSCVARQLGRCRGACIGIEPRALHDARLRLVLAKLRLRAWPFPGAIAIREPAAGRGDDVLHVLDRWRYLGSAVSEEELRMLAGVRRDTAFDIDTYRILNRWLAKLDVRDCIPLSDAGTGA